MAMLGEHAVVLGASMGGLLAARVLADYFGTVTVVERDLLPEGLGHRRGVPQGRHVHGLLSSGAQALGELFPGLPDRLVADGAIVLDDNDLSRVSLTLGGHELNRSGRLAKPLVTYLAGRPFLEGHVRDRIRAITNIRILDGHDAVELVTAGADRVAGAVVAGHDSGTRRSLDADLVVDSMDRAGRTPAFLESIGYARPAEDRIAVQVAYASQLLHVPPGAIDVRLFLIASLKGHAVERFSHTKTTRGCSPWPAWPGMNHRSTGMECCVSPSNSHHRRHLQLQPLQLKLAVVGQWCRGNGYPAWLPCSGRAGAAGCGSPCP